MESIVLPSQISSQALHGITPTSAADKGNVNVNSPRQPRLPSFSTTRDQSISWGRRHHHGSFLQALGCAGVMVLSPLLVVFYWISLSSFHGSISLAWQYMIEVGPVNFFSLHAPRPSMKASVGYGAWLFFQAALYLFLPSVISTGQLTPAGNLLRYRTNGMLAWAVSHALFFGFSLLGYLDPATLARNWEGLLVAANIWGFLLASIAYIKAHASPTHELDRKFSGSVLYDMYMGIELNPRFGNTFDFKLYTNGRPGIIAWTLIDFSFIVYQYQLHGYITNSIIISTILHTIYVVDFFINEDWYLRTIDICHEHFGFYLAWGSAVWLPGMYTLQTQYLARNPVALPTSQAIVTLLTGVSGYILFRSVNHQKDLVRRTKGACTLWGSPAKILRVKYHTKDNVEHNSILLYSGWWGLARHVNYLGDLILSYSMCAACGFDDFLPWTYAVFMTVLLVHRCWRDEKRCSMKYGEGWEEYRKLVKWVIIPGIY